MNKSELNRGVIEHYTLYHRHAPAAWLVYMFIATPIITIVLHGHTIPTTQTPIIGAVLFIFGMGWFAAGASIGWMPRP